MKYLKSASLMALVFVTAASCPSDRGRFDANGVDSARSASLAADPWLAPAEIKHGGFRGTNIVEREKITRESAKAISSTPEALVLAEIVKATQNGWTPTYVRCGPAKPGPFTWSPSGDSESLVAEANLEKSPKDLDHAAYAKLVAYVSDSQDDGGPFKLLTRISAYPAYHSDRGWPDLPSVPLESSCLTDRQAGASGQKNVPGFPNGVVEGLSRSQPLNEKGEPDGSAR